MTLAPVEARDWYETIRMADDVTLIHEKQLTPLPHAALRKPDSD